MDSTQIKSRLFQHHGSPSLTGCFAPSDPRLHAWLFRLLLGVLVLFEGRAAPHAGSLGYSGCGGSRLWRWGISGLHHAKSKETVFQWRGKHSLQNLTSSWTLRMHKSAYKLVNNSSIASWSPTNAWHGHRCTPPPPVPSDRSSTRRVQPGDLLGIHRDLPMRWLQDGHPMLRGLVMRPIHRSAAKNGEVEGRRVEEDGGETWA